MFFCVLQKNKSLKSFKMTWGWVNDDRSFICGWTLCNLKKSVVSFLFYGLENRGTSLATTNHKLYSACLIKYSWALQKQKLWRAVFCFRASGRINMSNNDGKNVHCCDKSDLLLVLVRTVCAGKLCNTVRIINSTEIKQVTFWAFIQTRTVQCRSTNPGFTKVHCKKILQFLQNKFMVAESFFLNCQIYSVKL